jgi:5-methylthioadenosine/S-adenosylhomocysteine deaminase
MSMSQDIIDLEDVYFYDSSSRAFQFGSLRIENGIIKTIDRHSPNTDETKFVIPGFVNTHCHIAMSRFRGLLDDINLEEFLNRTFELDKDRSREDIFNSSICGIYELLENGVTSFLDLYYDEDIIWEACDIMGIRSFLSWNTLDKGITTQSGDPIDNGENFIKDFKDKNKLITPSVGIQGVYVASLETMKRANEISRNRNTMLHMHVSETRKEVYEFKQKTGKRPVEFLSEHELLSNRLNAAHCVWLNDYEIRQLAKYKVNISWNAESNEKLGVGGIPPIPELMESGVNISIGTDSNGSNNSLNILETAKTGSLSVKNARWNAALINSSDLFSMLTENGGKATGMEGLGTIEEGKPADLNIIQGSHYSIQCSNPKNMINNIVFSMNPSAISETIIGGQYIKKDGKMRKDIKETYKKSLEFLKNNFNI